MIKSLILCFLLLANVNYVCAQQSLQKSAEENSAEENKVATDKVATENKQIVTKNDIDYLQSDNITNQIPYFDNRFRIDAELEEITLIFFRKRGSKPVILVQPDGKKLRIYDYDRENVQWHDDRTFDMIVIKKPMVGPWQTIGNVLPESKIFIVSEVKLVVEALPEIVFSGETLKMIGKLYNGNNRINIPQFREVVKLDVNFFSTNNASYDNFGADAFKLASFRDDGRDLDEYAGDSIYTGEFLLDFAAGEWQPVYVIKLPMMTRELHQKPIILHKNPVTISVEMSQKESIPHRLILSIDPTNVDPKSLVFQGDITFPDKQIKPFSIMEIENDENTEMRIHEISYTEPGIHRINLKAFGNTILGREFRLVVPEFTFNVEYSANKALLSTVDDNGVTQLVEVDEAQLLADKAAKLAQAKAEQARIAEEEKMQTIIMIAVGNSFIIILALILYFVMRKKKSKKAINDLSVEQ